MKKIARIAAVLLALSLCKYQAFGQAKQKAAPQKMETQPQTNESEAEENASMLPRYIWIPSRVRVVWMQEQTREVDLAGR